MLLHPSALQTMLFSQNDGARQENAIVEAALASSVVHPNVVRVAATVGLLQHVCCGRMQTHGCMFHFAVAQTTLTHFLFTC